MHQRIALAGLILLHAASCKRPAPPAAADLAPALPPGVGLPPTKELKPVYATTPDGPPSPLAQRLCQALHGDPEARRAACCKAPPGVDLSDDCVRTLSASLRTGAVRLDEGDVDRCARERGQALAGCGWVGPFPPPLPPSCVGLIKGTLAPGARCRSTLECQGTLRCRGAGPTDFGVCAQAAPPGESCGTGVDTLAAYTRQESIERSRPECAGFCPRSHVCVPALRTGEACVTSGQCGPGARCAAGRCAAGALASLGQACSGGDCDDGLRCHKGRCIAPAAVGVACGSDFECQGGCVQGACAPRCDLR